MKKNLQTCFLIGIGLLLCAYALLGPALRLFGSQTIAVVTDIHRQGGDMGGPIRNRYRWGVGYYFSLPDGTRIEGATNIIGTSFNAGIAKGPAPVLYFSALPMCNLLESQAKIKLASLLLLGVGFLFFWLGLKSRTSKTNRKKSGKVKKPGRIKRK